MHNYDSEIKLEQLAADDEQFNTLLAVACLMLPQETGFSQAFSQGNILGNRDLRPYNKLRSLNKKYNGLCEIISNYVIAEDLLGAPDEVIRHRLEKIIYTTRKNTLQLKINLPFLDAYSETHILDKATISAFSLAYFFDSYPLSLFTPGEMQAINKEGGRDFLIERFNQLPVGSYVKFEVFKKTFFTLTGHSMVIKKMPSGFAFFDPSTGEEHLDMQSLLSTIHRKKTEHSATTIAFIDGSRYIQAVQPDIKPMVSDENPSEHPITQEIIAELRAFISGNQFDNESVLKYQDKLQTEISKYLKNPKTHPFSVHSRQFNKQKLIIRLQQFEEIKWKANAHRFELQFKKVDMQKETASADEIIAPIQSFDDLMSCVYVSNNIMAGFSSLLPVQEKATALIDTSYKYKIAYATFPLTPNTLVRLIDSAKSMNDIFWAIHQRGSEYDHFRYDIYDLISEQCPAFIQDLSDLIDVLEYLPDSTQRDAVCEKIKHRLPEILSKEKGTACEYCAALSLLSGEHQSRLIQTMLAQQPMHLEALSFLYFLSEHLNARQFAHILSSVVEQIPDAMVNEQDLNALDNIKFVIKRINSSDWDRISIRVSENMSFDTLVLLSQDASINKQRLVTLISHWIAVTPIDRIDHSLNHSCYTLKDIRSFPHECRGLFFDKIKVCLLDKLDAIDSCDGDACHSAVMTILFGQMIDYYSEDTEVIDKLSDYLVKNNLKHVKESNAKQIVVLLMEGLTHKDAAKINAASALYHQQKNWLPLLNSNTPFDQLVPGLSRKIAPILNPSPQKRS
ncbi:MAG: hypothetical protein NXI01_02045 [Gammaproteobacteria bacterium]|nr:hypothetical protein [Gammaproteobacteria bacterium]